MEPRNEAKLREVLVFGGTSEGRMLVEWLSESGACRVVVCCATDYGAELVSGLPRVEAHVGPSGDDSRRALAAAHDFALIVDATHPYATHVSSSIARLSEELGIRLIQLVRPDEPGASEAAFESMEAAAAHLSGRAGNILLTTGTKDLETFVRVLPDFTERLFVRLLPVVDSIAHARELGLPASHIIAMQGPFSVEMNRVVMRELSIAVMVTKASGAAGGFAEKIEAAQAEGVEIVVVGRPSDEQGLTLEDVKALLAEELSLHQGASAESPSRRPDEGRASADAARKRIKLVAMGMGDEGTLTADALRAIRSSDMLVGAPRLLAPLSASVCPQHALVRSDDILRVLQEASYTQASVLFSGDVGFYSGARALMQSLDAQRFDVEAIPGVSSLAYLCAKLLTPWQDVHVVSAHGRTCDPVAEVAAHEKTFFLTGGAMTAGDLCASLAAGGFGNALVHVGERLSYDDERVVSGTAADLASRAFEDLSVILVENPDALRSDAARRETS